MAFDVRLTPEAADDAETLFDSLNSSPRRCPMVPDPVLRAFQVRYLLYGRKPHLYRILFRVFDEQKIVEVLHIRHGAMRPLEAPAE